MSDRFDCPGWPYDPKSDCRHGGLELPFWHVVRRTPPGETRPRSFCPGCAEDIDRARELERFNAAAKTEGSSK